MQPLFFSCVKNSVIFLYLKCIIMLHGKNSVSLSSPLCVNTHGWKHEHVIVDVLWLREGMLRT
jgi:hypothetical protein